jgi:23S rRNA (adenine-N6)-dimethyltransferase
MVDIRYSQNLYTNKENLQRLIKLSKISRNDIVLDIGAGTGIITEELSKNSKKVIAYELDRKHFNMLEENFLDYSNVLLKNEDFLNTLLPQETFKVFSNIPFSITAEIVNKISVVDSKLKEAFLFVQKESAERFTGKPKNTQISTTLSFIYEISVVENFKREDFKPIPNVDIVLLNLKRKSFCKEDYELYSDFVTYVFNQRNSFVLETFKKLFTYKQLKYIKECLRINNYFKPTDIPSNYYLDIFQKFKLNGKKYVGNVKNYSIKHLDQHSERKSLDRTRKKFPL